MEVGNRDARSGVEKRISHFPESMTLLQFLSQLKITEQSWFMRTINFNQLMLSFANDSCPKYSTNYLFNGGIGYGQI